MLSLQDQSLGNRPRKTSDISHNKKTCEALRARLSAPDLEALICPSTVSMVPSARRDKSGSTSSSNSDLKEEDRKKGFMTLGHRNKLRRALVRMNILPKGLARYKMIITCLFL